MNSRIFRIILVEIGGFIIPLVLFLFTTPIYLYRLGIAVYGFWILVNTLVGLGGVLDLGLAQTAIKYLSSYQARGRIDELRILFSTLVSVYLFLGFVSIGLAFVVVPYFNLDLVLQEASTHGIWVEGLVGVTIFLNINSNSFYAIVGASQRYDLISLTDLVVRSTLILVGALLVNTGFPFLWLLAVGLLLQFVRLLLFAFIAKWLVPSLTFQPQLNIGALQKISRFGVYNGVLTAAGQAFSYADRLLVGLFVGPQALAFYNIADNFSIRLHQLFSVVSRFQMPYVSSLGALNDPGSIANLLHIATRATSIAVASLAIPISLCAQIIIGLWLGHAIENQTSLLVQILLAAYTGAVLTIPHYNILLGLGKADLAARLVGIAMSLLIIAYVFLIPRLGSLGAALGFLAYSWIGVMVVPPIVLKQLGIERIWSYWITLVPAVVGSICALALETSFHWLTAAQALQDLVLRLGLYSFLVFLVGIVADIILFRNSSLALLAFAWLSESSLIARLNLAKKKPTL